MKTEDAIKVSVQHRFRQPAERVFDAWLDVTMVRRFLFSRETGEMLRCDVDPRVGGRFVLTDRRPDGDAEHVGEYLVIERPRKLVFTFGIPAASPTFDIVTIVITPESDGHCTLHLTAEMQPEWKDYVDGARKGWAQILARLEQALA
ncbi:SRPBCC family protein [Rubrivivax sp. RP6-9]|uniref:SRPBCC family protein n=1 Tax=Rubrivivax sp. RP6-9 TaxID=3415750 RepID=UPI003CC6ACCC